jgi:hypothetical protein
VLVTYGDQCKALGGAIVLRRLRCAAIFDVSYGIALSLTANIEKQDGRTEGAVHS